MTLMHSCSLTHLKRFVADQKASTAIEYVLIASVISIAIVATAMSIGSTMRDDYYAKIESALAK
jgi:Flp pilus assembly pilin Flp